MSKIQSNAETTEDRINSLEIGVFIWVILVVSFGLAFLILNCLSLQKELPTLALVNGLFSFFMITVSIVLVAMKHA